MKNKKILFVCTGNTCRSVIAQALFQRIKDELYPELNYQADSAGIAAIEGVTPTSEAIFCMARHGMDISTYQAKRVNDKLIKNFSLILTMTNQQHDFLKKYFPRARHKIFLLRPYCLRNSHIKNQEIEDPFGKSMLFYEKICRQLEQDINQLIYRLKEG